MDGIVQKEVQKLHTCNLRNKMGGKGGGQKGKGGTKVLFACLSKHTTAHGRLIGKMNQIDAV